MCMIDLCTVVFGEELEILRYQARSIDRYVSNVNTIYVVINDLTATAQIDTADWGKYSSKVQVVRREIFGNHWHQLGWVSQQLIKLSVAAMSQAPHCVALDAKTIFVKLLPLVTTSSKLAVGLLPVYPVFEPSRKIVNQLWNIDLKQQLGPGGVPFWFDTHAVRAMIADIEQRTKQNFVKWFQDQGSLTEFLLYSGWQEFQHGLDFVAEQSLISVCNLCHSELALTEQKLQQMQNSHTASVHRNAWANMSSTHRAQYQNFLQQRLS